MQQFLSLVLTPKGVYYGAKEMDFTTGNIDADFKFDCDSNCEFQSLVAIGDNIKASISQTHKVAEITRENAKYHQKKPTFVNNIYLFLKTIFLKEKVASKYTTGRK